MKKYFLIAGSFFGFIITLYAQNLDSPGRVVVLSGGGSRGAWGAGFLKAMDSAEHPNYVVAIGTSTGSLLGPVVLSKNPKRYDVLYYGYTQVSQKSIFNVNPFNTNANVKPIQSFLRFAFGSKNIGESKPLRNRIKQFYSASAFDSLKASKREFVACVTNLTSGAVEYKSSNTPGMSYEDLVDWVWASCNQPVFMSTLTKDGSKYVDGGIRDNIPIEEGVAMALKHKLTRIDVIIHNSTDTTSLRHWPEKKNRDGIIPKIFRIIDIFSDETRKSDIIAGAYAASRLLGVDQKIELHLYSMPLAVIRQYNCYNSLIFDPIRQVHLWNAGYSYYSFQKSNKSVTPDSTVPGIDIYFDK